MGLWQKHSTMGQTVPPWQASPPFVTRSTLSMLRLRSATLPGFHSTRTFLATVWAARQSLRLLIFPLTPQPAPSPLHAAVVVTFPLVRLPRVTEALPVPTFFNLFLIRTPAETLW